MNNILIQEKRMQLQLIRNMQNGIAEYNAECVSTGIEPTLEGFELWLFDLRESTARFIRENSNFD
jgi:hypothetical protein